MRKIALFLIAGLSAVSVHASPFNFPGGGGGVATADSPTWTGNHTWTGKMTLPSTVTVSAANLDISTTTDGTGNSLFRANGTSEVVINERSGDIDFRAEADSNQYGFHFDAGILSGQGGVGIGEQAGQKLSIYIDAASAQNIRFQNANTGGFASWRARAVDTGEFIDIGVGGSAVTSPFTDAGYIYCESGLSAGFKLLTNGSNVGFTVDNSQVAAFYAPTQLYSRTTAQLDAYTPTAAGQLVYNSTLAEVCVSTGTGAGAFKTMGTVSLITGFPLACR